MSHKRDNLSDEIVRQLGKIPDTQLAEQAGVSAETIRRARMQIGQQAKRRTIQWTPEMDAMLGTDSDRAIGEKIGISSMAVKLRRQRMGVGPCRAYDRNYLKGPGNSTTGVVALTAHISAEVRKKAEDLRLPLLRRFVEAGLPMRDVSMWQVVEHAVKKLHAEMLP